MNTPLGTEKINDPAEPIMSCSDPDAAWQGFSLFVFFRKVIKFSNFACPIDSFGLRK